MILIIILTLQGVILMSVFTKLEAIKADTAATLAAVTATSTSNNQPVLDAVKEVKTELDGLVAAVGTEVP